MNAEIHASREKLARIRGELNAFKSGMLSKREVQGLPDSVGLFLTNRYHLSFNTPDTIAYLAIVMQDVLDYDKADASKIVNLWAGSKSPSNPEGKFTTTEERMRTLRGLIADGREEEAFACLYSGDNSKQLYYGAQFTGKADKEELMNLEIFQSLKSMRKQIDAILELENS